MPQTPDQVIEATLKAASIRAAASIMASDADAYGRWRGASRKAADGAIAEGLVALAVLIYREAKAVKWDASAD